MHYTINTDDNTEGDAPANPDRAPACRPPARCFPGASQTKARHRHQVPPRSPLSVAPSASRAASLSTVRNSWMSCVSIC